jgi:hypothetical protein
MISNSSIVQYSPNSEESDEQPLDFSKTRISTIKTIGSIPIKNENNDNNNRTISPQQPPISTPSTTASNCYTTPSPSPPELHNNHNNHTNQVLCQLLTGNLIPTSTGKLVSARNNNQISLQMQNEPSLRFNGLTTQSSQSHSPIMSTSPQNSVLQAMNSVMNERHNSSISPSGSASPIGLGPLNQVDMHFTHSPNASGVDRFGTSGGLLTTASAAGVFAGNESAKRALKYSRPFKAYPRDPLSIPMSYYGVPLQMPLTADAIATQSLLATASDQAYLQFREQMLVSRKSSQEPRRSSVSKPLLNNSATSTSTSTPERMSENHSNSNNNSNTPHHQNHQNIYSNRSITPPKEMIAPLPKTNGSATMTPITPSQVHSDENSQYSNGNSSGNSSGGEGDMGSMTGGSDAQNMRKRGRPLPEDLKDEAYWERRRKNNEAAKRSRDARRAKEDEIAIRAAFLEQENLKLRVEIAQLKTETAKLRCLLYNS